MNNLEKRRVFCFGLDGGTFDLVDRWIHEGHLPNLKAMLETGTRATLNSVILPFTPQAWASFMTGVNPGKHGVFGFKEKLKSGYSFQLVNNRSIKSRLLWEMLSENNKHVILVNIPMTYPPQPVNGIIVAGMDAPGIASNFTFPSSIKNEIFRVAHNYVIHLHVGAGYLDTDVKRRRAIDELIDMVAAREQLILHLIDNYPWDFLAVNFTETDQIQHHFWQFLDSESEFADAILRVYKRVDQAIGKITSKLGDDVIEFVVSDHGAGPASQHVIFIDEWLRAHGLLNFGKPSPGTRIMVKLIGVMLEFLSRTLSSEAKDVLMRMFPQLRAKSQGLVRRSLIDWSSTRVYSGEHPATLRINLKGRDKEGIVEGHESYETLRSDLILKLESLKHPETHERLIDRVFRREDLYDGPYVGLSPDLIIYPKDFAQQIVGGAFPRSRAYRQVISEKDGRKFFVSGTHRVAGMFIARGKAIRSGISVPPLNIVDMFPTILYSLGMRIPRALDGKLVTEIFTEDFIAKNPAEYIDCSLDREDGFPTSPVTYTEDESLKVEQSLRSLGYID